MVATYEQTQMQLVAYPIDEKHALETDELINESSHVEHANAGHCCRSKRGIKRNAIVKGGMIGLVVMLVTILAFVVMELLCPGIHPLSKRQNSGNSTNTGNAFTDHKYWIIIVCVVGILDF